MISQTIARRYAEALMALGREDGEYEKYGEELAGFASLMAETDLDEALVNPLYPETVRRKILQEVIGKLELSKTVTNFLYLLLDKGRIAHAPAISDRFQRMVDEANNVKRATVTTAAGVSDKVLTQVKESLEKMTGHTVIVETKEDPAIIGGIVARVGDLTLDGSIRTQLDNLKESLIKG